MSLPSQTIVKGSARLPDYLTIPSQLLKDREIKPLDRFVYGVVYWFAKLKLEKCIVSNKTIADMLFTTASTVANSISRLAKKGYLRVILDPATNSRLEIIPLIAFDPSSTDDTPLHLQVNPPSSTDEHNNNILIIDKQDKPENSRDYLKNLPQHDVILFAEKYGVTMGFVRDAADSALNWLDAHGRKMKNYRSFLMNWIKNDKVYKKVQPKAAEGFVNIDEARKRGDAW